MNLKWFGIGLGVGAGIAILSTPRTGAETREALKNMADKARERVSRKVEEEHYTITDVIDRIKEEGKTATGKADGQDKFREAS